MNTSKNHLHTNIAIELSLSKEDSIVDTKDKEIIEEAIELSLQKYRKLYFWCFTFFVTLPSQSTYCHL